MSVNNKDIRYPMSMVGFNWLLPQCFDLSSFILKQCDRMYVSMF